MKVKGKNLKVYYAGAVIACSRSCELSIDVDVTEIANPSAGSWRKYRIGKKGWSVTCSGLVDVQSGFSGITSKVGTEFTLQFVNSESSESVSGAAICKLAKITGTIQNLSQYSVEFIGNGQLT